MTNFLLNIIVVTRGERNKEQTALMDYGTHLPHPTARCFFCVMHWIFNRYQKHRIENLLTSINIISKPKSCMDPTLWTFMHWPREIFRRGPYGVLFAPILTGLFLLQIKTAKIDKYP